MAGEDAGFKYSADFSDYITNVERASRVNAQFTDSLFSILDATQKVVETQNKLASTFGSGVKDVIRAGAEQIDALAGYSRLQQATAKRNVETEKKAAAEITSIQTGLTQLITQNLAKIEALQQKRQTKKVKSEIKSLKDDNKEYQVLIQNLGRISANFRSLQVASTAAGKEFENVAKIAEGLNLRNALLAKVDLGKFDEKGQVRILKHIDALSNLIPKLGLTQDRANQLHTALTQNTLDFTKLTAEEYKAAVAIKAFNDGLTKNQTVATVAKTNLTQLGQSILALLGPVEKLSQFDQADLARSLSSLTGLSKDIEPDRVIEIFEAYRSGTPIIDKLTDAERRLFGAIKNTTELFARRLKAQQGTGIRDSLLKGVDFQKIIPDDQIKLLGQIGGIEKTITDLRLTKDEATKLFETLSQTGQVTTNASSGFLTLQQRMLRYIQTLKQATDAQAGLQKTKLDGLSVTLLSKLGGLGANFDDKGIRSILSALNSVTAASKGLDISKVETLFDALQQGKARTANLPQELQKLQVEMLKLIQTFTTVKRLSSGTEPLLGGLNFDALKNIDQTALTRSINGLQSFAIQAGISDDRLKELFDIVQKGPVVFGNYTQAELKAIEMLRRHSELIRKFSVDNQQLQKELTGLKTELTAALGGLGNFDPASTKRILTALESVGRAAKNVDLARVKEIFENIRGGGPASPNLPPDEAKVQSSLVGLINAFEKAGQAGQSSGQKVLLTWTAVFRLFIIQQLHTIVGRFTASLVSAINTAAELEIRIAEIQTISSDLDGTVLKVQKSTELWRQSLRGLSDDFNLDILDVAKGAYQAISNQVTDAANSQRFLSNAAAFAKLNVTTLNDSVDLLSSTLNSYALGLESTIRAQSALFKTIELGRVVAGELSETFGNVTILASQLGIGMEEVGAAVAGLTRQGVKADNALTFLRNLFLKLIDPTDAMKGLLHEWNVETGAAAVAQFGLVGVLRKLQTEFQKTGDGAGVAAELFGRIRAIIPALALTGRDTFAQFEADLAEFGNTQEGIEKNFDSLSKKLELITQTSGYKFQQELNQTKNVLDQVFGDNFLRIFQNLDEKVLDLSDTVKLFTSGAVAGLNVVTDALSVPLKLISALDSALGKSGNSFGALVAGGTAFLLTMGALNLAVEKFGIVSLIAGRNAGLMGLQATQAAASATAALGKATIALGIVAAGYAIWQQNAEAVNAAIRTSHAETVQAINQANEKAAKARELQLAKELRIFELHESEKVRIVKTQLNQRLVAERQAVDGLVTRNEAVIDSLKEIGLLVPDFDKLTPKIKLEDPKDLFAEVEKSIQDSLTAIEKLKDTLNDFDTKDLNTLTADFQRLAATTIFNNNNLNVEQVVKTRDLFEDMLKTIEKIRDIRIKAVDKLKKDLEDSVKLLDKLKGDFDRDLFDFKLEGLSDKNKIAEITKRIQDLIAKSKQFEIAGDFEKARESLDEAVDLSKEIVSIQKNANKELADLGIKRPLDTKQYEAVAKERLDLEERIKNKTDGNLKTAQQELADFEKQAKEAIEKRLANEEKAVELIQKKAVETQLELERIQTIKKTTEEINILLDEQIKKRQKLNETLASDETKLQTFVGDVGGNVATLDALFQKISALDNAGHVLPASDAENGGYDDVVRSMEKIAEIRKRLETITKDPSATPEQKQAATALAIEEINKETAALYKLANVRNLIQKMQLGQGVLDGGGFRPFTTEESAKFKETIQFFAEAQKKLDELKKNVDTDKANIATLQQEIALNDQLLQKHGFVTDAAQAGAAKVAEAEKKINDELGTRLELLEKLGAAAVPKPTLPVQPGQQLPDGFDTGGQVSGKKGMDANLVPVSHGEMVINAKSTAKFKAQLKAMNLGISPRGFDTGGQTVNFNGGINVSIHGGKTNEASAREIASQLRKEMRRGTVKL